MNMPQFTEIKTSLMVPLNLHMVLTMLQSKKTELLDFKVFLDAEPSE
jgi:hypothetical protein